VHVPWPVIELGIPCTSLSSDLTHPKLYGHCFRVVSECEAKLEELQQDVLSYELL